MQGCRRLKLSLLDFLCDGLRCLIFSLEPCKACSSETESLNESFDGWLLAWPHSCKFTACFILHLSCFYWSHFYLERTVIASFDYAFTSPSTLFSSNSANWSCYSTSATISGQLLESLWSVAFAALLFWTTGCWRIGRVDHLWCSRLKALAVSVCRWASAV